MSLGAIDFGLIVDGAVVMVENISGISAGAARARTRCSTQTNACTTVLSAAKEVASPMFFGVLIITIVYVPILALTGIEGKMFKPMAITVIFALIGSLVLSLTLMPVLCSCVLRAKISEEDNFAIRFSKQIYSRCFGFALRFRCSFRRGAVALFAAAAAGL